VRAGPAVLVVLLLPAVLVAPDCMRSSELARCVHMLNVRNKWGASILIRTMSRGTLQVSAKVYGNVSGGSVVDR
jgi:hypothetical protein